jgi:hypothetical protein
LINATAASLVGGGCIYDKNRQEGCTYTLYK